MKRKQIIIVAVVFVGFLIVLMSSVGLYTDRAFICQNTGSQKGYREWFSGAISDEWYNKSSLEEFIAKSHKEELSFNWVSYKGTTKTIFGRLHAHGNPSNMSFGKMKWLNEYVGMLNDEDKLSLYHTFKTHDVDVVDQECRKYIDLKISDKGQVESNSVVGDEILKLDSSDRNIRQQAVGLLCDADTQIVLHSFKERFSELRYVGRKLFGDPVDQGSRWYY